MELFYSLRTYFGTSIFIAALLILTLKYSDGAQFLTRPQSVVVAFIIVAIYNTIIYPIWLSPLRKLPSVKLYDIRYLIPVTNVPRGDIALKWAKQHLGDAVIRIDTGLQTVLMPLAPEALRDVLSTHQDDYEKPASGRNFLSRILGNGMILSEGPTHSRQRKTMRSSFRIQNIRALHGIMLDKTHLMIEGMMEQMSQERHVEINRWASKATLDIIGHSLMSQDFDSLRVPRQPVNEAFGELTASNPNLTLYFILGMLLPKFVIQSFPTKTNSMIERNVRIVRDACADSLQKRRDKSDESSAGSEILSSILEDPLTTCQETIDQMVTFLGAGHETTAASVAWAVHLLTLPGNLHYQDHLREEITNSKHAMRSPKAMEELPWLNAVCEEVLRLYPPVTTTARKASTATTIAGTTVPKGTVVVLFPWAINRNPQFWGEASSEQFVPERWLDKSSVRDVKFNNHGGAVSNYCNMTFLHGQRSCIGKDFAKAELRCIIAGIFGGFEMRRRPGDSMEIEPAGSLTIKPKDGFYITMTRISAL